MREYIITTNGVLKMTSNVTWDEAMDLYSTMQRLAWDTDVNEEEYLKTIENIRATYGDKAADYIDDNMDSDDCGETYYLMLAPNEAARKVEQMKA